MRDRGARRVSTGGSCQCRQRLSSPSAFSRSPRGGAPAHSQSRRRGPPAAGSGVDLGPAPALGLMQRREKAVALGVGRQQGRVDLKTPREVCSCAGDAEPASARGWRLEDQQSRVTWRHRWRAVCRLVYLDRTRGTSRAERKRRASGFRAIRSDHLSGEADHSGLVSTYMPKGGYSRSPTAPRYDAVIVGAGPAGLSCAMALAAAGRRVLVIESGGAAAVAGDHSVGYGHFAGGYWNQHWVRGLGGTSQAWTGWCTIPTPLDFETRRWIDGRSLTVVTPYCGGPRRSSITAPPRRYQAPFPPASLPSVPTMAPTQFAGSSGRCCALADTPRALGHPSSARAETPPMTLPRDWPSRRC